ncbi:aldo/keto reductase [Pseudomonas sp. TE3610]
MSRHDPIATTTLGQHGPRVGVQGLGCMGMSEFYGVSDRGESLATLEQALDRGATLIDTADMYGSGDNERLIGEVIRKRREEVVIASKVGFVRAADGQSFTLDNRPEYIRRAVEESLRRLGVDELDVYYLHRRVQEVPLADSIGAMAELVKAGKVRYLGLSEVTADELQQAHRIHPISAVQSEWSLFARDVEAQVVPMAAQLGVALVPYSPLGRGLLTGAGLSGAEGDLRGFLPQFSGAAGEHNRQLVTQVTALAQQLGVTAAQVALAWVHQRAQVHGLTVVPIPGTRRRGQLEENLHAATLKLEADALAGLDALAAQVQGSRLV